MLTPVTILPSKKAVQLDLFEVAPGVRVTVAKPAGVKAPRVGIITWKPAGDGIHWIPQIETHSAVVNIKKWDEDVYGVSRFVIRALVAAGFVDGEMVSPRSLTINLESWFAHGARMRENPFFWHDLDNRKRYSTAAEQVCRYERRHRVKKRKTDETAPAAKTPASAVLTPELPQTPRRGSAGAKESHSSGRP